MRCEGEGSKLRLGPGGRRGEPGYICMSHMCIYPVHRYVCVCVSVYVHTRRQAATRGEPGYALMMLEGTASPNVRYPQTEMVR